MLLPKLEVSKLPTLGEFLEAPANIPVSRTRHRIMPTKLVRSSLLRPALSTKYMLTMVPRALRPDVIRESARAVLLEAKPAN